MFDSMTAAFGGCAQGGVLATSRGRSNGGDDGSYVPRAFEGQEMNEPDRWNGGARGRGEGRLRGEMMSWGRGGWPMAAGRACCQDYRRKGVAKSAMSLYRCSDRSWRGWSGCGTGLSWWRVRGAGVALEEGWVLGVTLYECAGGGGGRGEAQLYDETDGGVGGGGSEAMVRPGEGMQRGSCVQGGETSGAIGVERGTVEVVCGRV